MGQNMLSATHDLAKSQWAAEEEPASSQEPELDASAATASMVGNYGDTVSGDDDDAAASLLMAMHGSGGRLPQRAFI